MAMKTLVGGAIAAALGLVGLGIWWGEFLMVLAGIIPVMLLLGGGLAIYLGFDELKDTWKKDDTFEPAVEKEDDEVERYRKEIDDLKEEIKSLKKE
jgi:cell division protein FtsB